ncbi:ACR047Cp [Eremothecium gossypii ATCC 10895]|uniref:ACR047Cp n=1 Tax=Eremothecium gossypii (strain ATCC 10895 / CBS 109.51 / FGSC 9923 / NRRL Y-1056) TaxID=284811 RepID=Q75C69_EREGS|nr:ACR047Cp [Eremothecium gossypii ATCC 10895]AAS51274.1 ACR047Cp [Eremothecium gossypii ATCC 10895]AEY95565.1 FACR047Cp [Eremothecium gossypii FDAG1]
MSDEALKKQVEELQALVKRQSVLITKTGQSVLELQVSKQKHDMANLDEKFLPKGGAGKFDTTDFATNEDLVQLVGELQGQLDTMEERSVRRLVNSTKSEEKDFLAPLPNADGEIPDVKDGVFPLTLGDFESLDNVKLYKLAKFYELLPPTLREQEKFEEFLEGKVENFHISETPDADIEAEVKRLTEEQLNDIFNDIARYLGLRSRRGTSVW